MEESELSPFMKTHPKSALNFTFKGLREFSLLKDRNIGNTHSGSKFCRNCIAVSNATSKSRLAHAFKSLSACEQSAAARAIDVQQIEPRDLPATSQSSHHPIVRLYLGLRAYWHGSGQLRYSLIETEKSFKLCLPCLSNILSLTGN